jgi:16S rRNA (guanine527-N7)-methyltransferase
LSQVHDNDKDTALALTPVSRETQVRLEKFVDYLLERQQTLNLIGNSTIPQLWTRHIADSLQLLDLAPAANTWVDIGSGAGFPGIVLACALNERPRIKVHLVESIAKKAAFLREAARITGASAQVHNVRMETLRPQNFGESSGDKVEVVTARAVAPLKVLLDQSFALLQRGAIGLYMKGQDVASELTEAAKYWSIEHELIPSRTSPGGTIVKVVHCELRHQPRSVETAKKKSARRSAPPGKHPGQNS